MYSHYPDESALLGACIGIWTENLPPPDPASVADRMGVTKGRVSQIQLGKVSGNDVLARYAAALAANSTKSTYFDNGDTTAIA